MRSADIVVIGGGPAGLSAAIVAAEAGCQVVLIDEAPLPGGCLRWRIHEVPDDDGQPTRAWVLAERLAERARTVGVDIRSGAVAWGLFPDTVVAVAAVGPVQDLPAAYHIRATRIILATGSTDRSLPFPGGSLPGVFSARAAQILMHLHRVVPGRRVVVVGAGPESDEVAADLVMAGVEVVARVDPGQGNTGMMSGLTLRAVGETGVTSVMIDGTLVAAEGVIIATGRQPDAQLAIMAGCACGFLTNNGGWAPSRTTHLETSISGLYVAGDAGGIGDDRVPLLEGRLSGIAAARSLGHADDADVERAMSAFRNLSRERELEEADAPRLSYTQV